MYRTVWLLHEARVTVCLVLCGSSQACLSNARQVQAASQSANASAQSPAIRWPLRPTPGPAMAGMAGVLTAKSR